MDINILLIKVLMFKINSSYETPAKYIKEK
jgi:hypothetical protein